MENYLYPFFWQHGEPESVIAEYMDQISACGMKAACIEARPHPDFVGETWWSNMELLIRKAKEHGMRLWILDDAHFPTGYANGKIKESYPQYRKLYLSVRRFDVAGEMKGARINAGILKGRPWEKPGLGDKKIVGVYLAKRSSNRYHPQDDVDMDSIVELPGAYQDNLITVDIPKGSYSIFVVFTTYEGGEEATADYLNPLMAEATQVLIDEVYEPHYRHFADEFGKTITGFFSDEPRFGNIKGTKAVIGTDMVLPWREHLEEEIPFNKKYLPLLWYAANGMEKQIRYQYMDMVTRLYSENFTKVLADWCHAHGVSYLGHNIEDDGAHARLGYGTGHYFRGQADQDYAGVDVIGTQIVPGMPYHHDAFSTGGANGEFYHYALAKLAASAAHLDPKKQGRAICEAFGAYGWNEGLKLMKWITDHLISRGITHIVPHAFDPKKFPDWDCPPHFYAQGNNPQFRYFPVYTAYTNRMLEIFNHGVSAVKAAVLYHAKLEWCGACMPVEKILRELCEHQIDCDIVSEDYLKGAVSEDGKLIVNAHAFEMLIVPYATAMPADVYADLYRLASGGAQIIFAEDYPKQIVGGENLPDEIVKTGAKAVPLSELADACEAAREVTLAEAFAELVYYHYSHENYEALMFFNESVAEQVDTWVTLPVQENQNVYVYDAFADTYCKVSERDGRYRLSVRPYESVVYILTEEVKQEVKEKLPERLKEKVLDLSWDIRFADAKTYPDFTERLDMKKAGAINEVFGYENRTGTLAYEAVFDYTKGEGRCFIDLGTVYETAELFLNGKSAGVRICPPYEFEVTELLKSGENQIRLEITNTLGTQIRDGLSQYLVIEPFGLVGDVTILEENR